MFILCKLWWSNIRGEMTLTAREWARLCHLKLPYLMRLFRDLDDKNIATFGDLDLFLVNQNPNQKIKVISRRMTRDYEISLLRQAVGSLGGNPGLKRITENREEKEEILDNQNSGMCTNQNDQSSSSSSSSKNKSTPLPPAPTFEEKIFSLFRDLCPEFPQPKNAQSKLGKKICAYLRERARERKWGEDTEPWKKYFEKCNRIDGLKNGFGEDRNWRASFDWLVRPTNMEKVESDYYQVQGKVKRSPQLNDWICSICGNKSEYLEDFQGGRRCFDCRSKE